MNFIVDFFQRLQSESPRFFIIVRWVMGTLTAVALLMQKIMADELWLPANADKIKIICGYIITATLAIFGTSFLAKKDINEPPKQQP
jgi:hypothetical protein